MPKIEQQIIDKILEASRIEDIVGRFVKLKKNGSSLTGLCPFHKEKSPSFTVNTSRQFFKCFGCGAGGDVIHFVELYQGIEFPQAIEFLSNLSNMDIQLKPDAPAPLYQPYNFKSVDRNIMLQTMQQWGINILFNWFASLCGAKRAEELFWLYYTGTAADGSTIFWQVDKHLNVRTGSKMKYNGFNRDKARPPFRLFKGDDGYSSCLFGEHLLKYAKQEDYICIVESEKTAMICSLYMPEMNNRKCYWLASTGANGLTDEKIQALKGLRVILWPDFSYTSAAVWGAAPMKRKIVDEIVDGIPRKKTIIAPDGELDEEYKPATARILAAGAIYCKTFDAKPDVDNGSDIADYLIREPVPVFQEPEPVPYPGPLVFVKTPPLNNYRLTDANLIEMGLRQPTARQKAHQQFEHLLQKNPALGTMIEKFDLRLEAVNGVLM